LRFLRVPELVCRLTAEENPLREKGNGFNSSIYLFAAYLL
jgi:hypothetical protein